MIRNTVQFQLDEAVAVLQRTPAVLDALLGSQSAAWLHSRIKQEGFSPLDVVGHLIFGEITDWIPRARMILECQESRAFDPFDRFGFGPLMEGKSAEELVHQFAELLAMNLETLRAFELEERTIGRQQERDSSKEEYAQQRKRKAQECRIEQHTKITD